MQRRASRFAADHTQARAKFRAAVEIAGATLEVMPHPDPGPLGEALSMDAAWLGDPDAGKVVVLTSGVHGPELFCGSAAQVDTLLGMRPEPGTAFLMVHAVNPHGAAWLRRTNEDNIDINRNFADFASGLPDNPGYTALRDALLPADTEPATMATADAAIGAFRLRHGEAALRVAMSGGQYTDPDGLFYGGAAPCWSRRMLEALVRRHELAARDRVVAIDFHTGAGPYGYCEPIYSGDPDHPGFARLRDWLGPRMTVQRGGESATPPQLGLISELWERQCGANAAYVSLEYGTLPTPEVMAGLRHDQILWRNGVRDWNAARVQSSRARLRAIFAPQRSDWEASVLVQAEAVIGQVAAGLGS